MIYSTLLILEMSRQGVCNHFLQIKGGLEGGKEPIEREGKQRGKERGKEGEKEGERKGKVASGRE